MPKSECPGCQELQGRVAELEALVRELQAQLGNNATNSSMPPSANPPEAPKPGVKKLWTFVEKAGVEPTNNHVERALRSGVLWRKQAFGCHSLAGCRLVERIVTAVQTLRLQKRPVLEFLHQAVSAYRHGKTAP